MRATFGGAAKYLYENIKGYSIRVGLQATRGIDNTFYVTLLLRSDSNQKLPKLPTWDGRIGNQEPVKDDLVVLDGKDGEETLKYVFPGIEFLGSESSYSNGYQYHLLHFRYLEEFNPNPPGIEITNTKEPQHAQESSKSDGTLLIGEQELPAPLLGFQSNQVASGSTCLRMVTERCKRKGWLPEILEQNKKCGDSGPGVDLRFEVNGKEFKCQRDLAKDNQGLQYLTYEEYYGQSLNHPALSLPRIGEYDTPSFLEHDPLVSDIVPCDTGRFFLADWQAGRRRSTDSDVTPDEAVEICTVVTDTPSGRLFDWRTKKMKGE